MTAEEFIQEWNSANDYIIAHTSGSTGIPKKINLSKELVRSSAYRTIRFFNLNSQSHLHLCLSPDYIAGKMMIVRSLIIGANLTFEVPSNEPLSDYDFSHDIDLLAVVPSQLHYILDNRALHSKIKNIIIGGSAIPSTLREQVANSNLNAYETYGMTETASHVALRKISNDSTLPYFALPDILFTTDERSCLVIKMPDNNYVITNDVVKLIDDRHFVLLGRYDNVIISGGMKIHPIEVENIIQKFLPINTKFYISSRKNEKWGEEVILILEKNIATIIDDSELMGKIKKSLLSYQCPKEILYIDKIKYTDSGKIIRTKF